MSTTEQIRIRNLRFALGPEMRRYWHGGRRAISLYFDNLSLFFPAGERFFIASVKAHVPSIRDPELLREVQAFCGQEGVHSREHTRYNRMLDAQGYPASALEQRIDARLRRVAGRIPVRRQLAITCALEHFTAIMGEAVLADPRVLAGADEEMAALWRWHAAEENEHKAVAFDVYARVGGNYFERMNTMLAATLMFWTFVLIQQARLMRADGCLWSVREWASLWSFLFVTPGPMRKVIRNYLPYFRPDFHPWQLGGQEHLDAWRRQTRAAIPGGLIEESA